MSFEKYKLHDSQDIWSLRNNKCMYQKQEQEQAVLSVFGNTKVSLASDSEQP
jgi:hypothetical protein